MKKLLALALMLFTSPAHADCVVLLHGLSRTENSMLVMQETLEFHGYRVVNDGYPSNAAPIADLVAHVGRAAARCGRLRTHFVTHSMGGILVRAWLRNNRPVRMGRVVMLAPPNHGTEVVDNLAQFELLPDLLDFLHGPAARELGTDPDSVPNRLPPVDYELGVIAGNRALSPLGPIMIEGANDGTVSVASTRVEGMTDHIVLPATHTMMMVNPIVLAEVLEFLRHGTFDHGITLANALRKLANP
ncbi:MAG: esterase/lipase family protein [Pararhodobacter sp.]